VLRSIASDNYVERPALEEFVRTRHRAILCTQRRDGAAQMSPVTMGMDLDGALLVSSYPERAKVLNLRRRQQASACVLSDEFGGPWVQISGNAVVVDLPEALEGLITYYRSISGEHPDWREYQQAMIDQGKVLIRLVPERWGPISKSGFPSRLGDS
jgi:PPOX class probable F420-dependent enzyme